MLFLPTILLGESIIQQDEIDKNLITQLRGAYVTTPVSNVTFGFPGASEYGNGICGDADGIYVIGYSAN